MLPPKSKGPLEIMPIFLVIRVARCNNSSHTLEEVSQHTLQHWTPRNFTEVGRWLLIFCHIYFLSSDTQMSYQYSRVVATCCPLGP